MATSARAVIPPIALRRGPRSSTSFTLSRQLCAALRRAIVAGQLRPGQRLPSTRTLARELGLSRTPVLEAFSLLHAEGYLEAVVGSGTCVARRIVVPSGPPALPMRPRSRGLRLHKSSPALVPQPWLRLAGAFRMHVPALNQFPLQQWSRLVARHARHAEPAALGYGDPMGLPALREAIAAYLTTARGVVADPSRILVVAGSQQGLHLTASVLLRRGDLAWIEEPGYPGARSALQAAGARLIPVPVDAEGLDVAAGIRRAPKARLAYVTPSHQYPLGVAMSAARRLQLLDWAARAGGWIVEDDYDSEYRFGVHPLASLQGLDANSRVIYIGTFSKVVFPSLRLGYLVLPADLVPAFVAFRDATDICPPALLQAAMADFIQQGQFARHIYRMRQLYAGRCSGLIAALRARIGVGLEVVAAVAGMHITALLPRAVSDYSVMRAALRLGISVMPLSFCCLRPHHPGLVLGYGNSDLAQLQDAVGKLKLSLQAVAPAHFQ